MWFWIKEWVWSHTNLPHYNDSSGRICFGFLIYLFFVIIIPRCAWMRCDGEQAGVTPGSFCQKLDAGSLDLMMIHWWSSATNNSMRISEQAISWGTKQFGDIFIPSCNFLFWIANFQYCFLPEISQLSTRAVWAMMFTERELFLQLSANKKGLGFSDRDRLPWYGRLLVK